MTACCSVYFFIAAATDSLEEFEVGKTTWRVNCGSKGIETTNKYVFFYLHLYNNVTIRGYTYMYTCRSSGRTFSVDKGWQLHVQGVYTVKYCQSPLTHVHVTAPPYFFFASEDWYRPSTPLPAHGASEIAIYMSVYTFQSIHALSSAKMVTLCIPHQFLPLYLSGGAL